MINSSATTTPRRETSKRRSVEFHGLYSPERENDSKNSNMPETPSPPNKGRRSSTSLGFLATPIHTKLDSSLIGSDKGTPEIGGDRSGPDTMGLSSPSMKNRLFPPTTPKSRHNEVFLSPTPKLKSPSIYKESNKPIREISNTLKTRLNYAFVKLQNGWVDKTLPELETEFSQPKKSTYVNKFAQGDATEFGGLNNTPYGSGDSVDGTSAHDAFLKTLSIGQVGLDEHNPPTTSPMRWPTKNAGSVPQSPPSIPIKQKKPSTEVEVIETLMSLSSPQKSRPSTRIGREGEIEDDSDQTDVETEADEPST